MNDLDRTYGFDVQTGQFTSLSEAYEYLHEKYDEVRELNPEDQDGLAADIHQAIWEGDKDRIVDMANDLYAKIESGLTPWGRNSDDEMEWVGTTSQWAKADRVAVAV